MVVLLNHVAQISPSLAVTESSEPQSVHGSLMRWLAYSPLRLFWAGTEAVVVFFILSGFVLARAVADSSDRAWSGYFGKRFVRLYLPVVGALLLAVLLRVSVRPRPIFDGNPVLNHLTVHRGLGNFVNDAILLFKPGAWLPVLWSLRWEVIFSALLPLFVALGKIGRRHPIMFLTLLGGLMASSSITDRAFLYLPMFGIGVLLAETECSWTSWVTGRWGRSGPVLRLFTGVLCAVLLASSALVLGSGFDRLSRFVLSDAGFSIVQMLVTGGAALLVMMAICVSPVARVLEMRPVAWLGSRSYSLYLTHLPVVLTIAYVFKGWSWPGVVLIVLASLLMADVFYRFVERPSTMLARTVGEAVEREYEPSSPAEQ